MDYNELPIHYFICDPINNEKDKFFLECLKQQEKEFKKILQRMQFEEGYCLDDKMEYEII